MRTLALYALVCAAAVLLASPAAPAQKTEVTVLQGKVRAAATAGAVLVEPGQKAVLTTQASPTVRVDDPLVQDLLAMYPWIEAERKAERMRIFAASIQIYRLDKGTGRHAVLVEMPNLQSLPNSTCRIGETSLVGGARFYDLAGTLLSHEVQNTGNNMGYYFVRFPQPVPAGGTFRFTIVGDLDTRDHMRKQGALRYFTTSNGTPSCLSYYQVILPAGAILVDCNLPQVLTKDVDGRTSVTVRDYSGPQGDSRLIVSFLWPEADGTSLADLPPPYRGLPDALSETLAQEYRDTMRRILAGEAYEDFSTPIRAALSWNSAVARQDKQRILQASYAPQIDARTLDRALTPDFLRQLQYWVTDVDFLSTLPWPEHPEDGYVHPVYLSRPGSRMRVDTLAIAYAEGRWRRCGNMGNAWDTDVSKMHKLFQMKPRLQLRGRSLDAVPWNSVGSDVVLAFRDLLAHDDKDAHRWLTAGLKLAGAGHWEYALYALSHCQTLAAEGDTAFLCAAWQGHMYDMLAKRSEALQKYQAALAMPPRSVRHEQWNLVIDKAWLEQRLAEPFRDQMIHAPDNPAALNAAINTLTPGDLDKVRHAFDLCRAQDVRDARAWCHVGAYLAMAGAWEQVAEAMDRARRCDPEPVVRMISLALQAAACDVLGQRPQAIDLYRQALKVDHDEDTSIDGLGFVLNKAWLQQRLTDPFRKEMLDPEK